MIGIPQMDATRRRSRFTLKLPRNYANDCWGLHLQGVMDDFALRGGLALRVWGLG